jgi:hypothetical protein
MNTLPILVSRAVERDSETKSIFTPDADVVFEEVPIARLKENLDRLAGGLSQLFSDIKKVGAFRLSEISLQVEISAEAGVTMIGTSKVGGKGAITLKFVE